METQHAQVAPIKDSGGGLERKGVICTTVEIEARLKLTGVGWALLPVGVLDGQECPSYNGHAAIDVRG